MVVLSRRSGCVCYKSGFIKMREGIFEVGGWGVPCWQKEFVPVLPRQCHHDAVGREGSHEGIGNRSLSQLGWQRTLANGYC